MNEFTEWGEIKAQFFIMESHDATVARAEMEVGERIFEINASAKKHPIDREDERIGELYAMGRTLERMGNKMQKLADGYVREADNVRQDKKRRASEGRVGEPWTIAKPGYKIDALIPPSLGDDYLTEVSERYAPEDKPNKSIL